MYKRQGRSITTRQAAFQAFQPVEGGVDAVYQADNGLVLTMRFTAVAVSYTHLITVDNDTQTIQIDLPEVHISEINVDIASLDFMFYDSGADESAVTQEAFAACEADVRQESQRQEAIIELAQQNAVNVITALVKPIVEQLDADYVLVVA